MAGRPARIWDDTLSEWVDIIGIPGLDGSGGEPGAVPTFISTTEPTATPPWVWFDITGGDLQIKYEDGL